jgi:hypothetical protein
MQKLDDKESLEKEDKDFHFIGLNYALVLC